MKTEKPSYIVDAAIRSDGSIALMMLYKDIHYIGILRTTCEEYITLSLINKKIIFEYCCGIHSGCTYNYKKEEEELFNQDHPNLLKDLQQAYENKTLKYRYYVWDGKKNNEHITTNINDLKQISKK